MDEIDKLLKYKITYTEELKKVEKAIEDFPGKRSFIEHRDNIIEKLNEVEGLIEEEKEGGNKKKEKKYVSYEDYEEDEEDYEDEELDYEEDYDEEYDNE